MLVRTSAPRGEVGIWLIASQTKDLQIQRVRTQLKAVLQNAITKEAKSNGLSGSQAKAARNGIKKMLTALTQSNVERGI